MVRSNQVSGSSLPPSARQKSGGRPISIAIPGVAGVGAATARVLVTEIAKFPRPELFQIVLYEPNQPGAGLAYGTSREEHLLNMRSGQMSALPDAPHHFLIWGVHAVHQPFHARFVSEVAANDHHPRKIFGVYLEELFEDTQKMAALYGIDLRVERHRVLGVEETDVTVRLTTSLGTFEHDYVVFCLGNQAPTAQKSLAERRGYFPHVWPEQRLMQGVPKNASVLFHGASLTAVDGLVSLQCSHHTGRVIFASRHGILPKARGRHDDYKLIFLTPANADKAIVDHGRFTLDDAAALLLREFDHTGVIRSVEAGQLTRLCRRAPLVFRTHLARLAASSPIDVLEEDIRRAAEMPELLSVLKAIDEIIGTLWSKFSQADRDSFDKNFAALWNAYDYPMPTQNANKLLVALRSGSLTVARLAGETHYEESTESFVTPCRFGDEDSTDVHTDCVINAVGQCLDITRVENPVIRDAVGKGLFRPHPSGGIDVDYHSGALRRADGSLSPRVFVVGSLTRGVHFYTNSICMNVGKGRDAVRTIMDSVRKGGTVSLGKKGPSKARLSIAMFVGSDISSHLMVNSLVPAVLAMGWEPLLVYPKHRKSNVIRPYELQELAFFEREILADTIYPYLDKTALDTDGLCHSPRQLAAKYGITMIEAENINHRSLLRLLRTRGVTGGISIRCYQKFLPALISFFNQRQGGFLWNLHPGLLPNYRGVMTFFRSLMDRQGSVAFSLHDINPAWDGGALIDVTFGELDPAKAMLTTYCELAELGASTILRNLAAYQQGNYPQASAQQEADAQYFTFPNRLELNTFHERGHLLVDRTFMRDVYLSRFSFPGTAHWQGLADALDLAITAWEPQQEVLLDQSS